jgi:hypothetical protein
MVFGMDTGNHPSVSKIVKIGSAPATATARAAATTSDIAVAGGNAATVVKPQAATNAEPVIPTPSTLSLDGALTKAPGLK